MIVRFVDISGIVDRQFKLFSFHSCLLSPVINVFGLNLMT